MQKESRIIKYLTTKIVIKHNCFGENFFLWENLNSIFPRFFYPFISEVVFKFKVVCQIFKFLSYTQCGRFLSLIIKWKKWNTNWILLSCFCSFLINPFPSLQCVFLCNLILIVEDHYKLNNHFYSAELMLKENVCPKCEKWFKCSKIIILLELEYV